MKTSQPNSFLALVLRLPIPKIRLHSIPLLPSSYPGRLASRNATRLDSTRLDYCSLILLLLLCFYYFSGQRVRVTLRLAVYSQSVRLGDKPLETQDQYFFPTEHSGHSPYVTFSLMRGWVCRLELLLALASAVILRSESRRTHDHILLSQIRDSPNLVGQVSIIISPGTGWPGYTPRHWVPFSSPPTTRRATVEVFDPTSTRDSSQATYFVPL
jgi:hypothetical protein